VDNTDLAFFHIFDRMNGVKCLFQTQGLKIFRNSNNILAWVH
jgi:hypothetical protein